MLSKNVENSTTGIAIMVVCSGSSYPIVKFLVQGWRIKDILVWKVVHGVMTIIGPILTSILDGLFTMKAVKDLVSKEFFDYLENFIIRSFL